MRILRLPAHAIGWYRDRLTRIRHGQVPTWATAEIVCMSLSLLALGLLLGQCVLRAAGVTWAGWVDRWVLPVMLSGAVGYLTNSIAVTMLFRPYDATDPHPAGAMPFWRQGLIPKYRKELAATAGRQMADRLLTPEVVAREIKAMVAVALDDESFREQLRFILGPVIREKLPAIIEAASPEIMRILRKGLQSGVSRENLEELFERVVEPWLDVGDTKEALVAGIVEVLQERVPELVDQFRTTMGRGAQESRWREVLISAAEWAGGLNWREVRADLRQELASSEVRARIRAVVEQAVARHRAAVASSGAPPVVRHLYDQASDFVAEFVEHDLVQTLPEFGHVIADDPRLWSWLANEAMPAAGPGIMRWLENEGLFVTREHFDVAGRVEEAILELDVREFHEMINDVSARHLGAIQVLGYILGLIIGGLHVLA